MTPLTDKKQYPSEQYLNELITNIEFAARAPVEVVRAMAAELQKRREADSAEPVSQTYKFPVNTPCQDAPAHIWLQTAGVWPENGELSELTWCSHNQHCCGQLKLATALEFFQYRFSDSFGGNPPLYSCGLSAL